MHAWMGLGQVVIKIQLQTKSSKTPASFKWSIKHARMILGGVQKQPLTVSSGTTAYLSDGETHVFPVQGESKSNEQE